MASRSSKSEGSSPDSTSILSGGGASVDRLYDISQRVSTIEKSMTYLEAHAEDARKKLETISADIVEARATFKAMKAFFVAIFVATWGLLSAVILMWAKHRFGW